MAELYLVRHGQASFGADNYDELSPSGRTQSGWLGEYFAQAGLRFDRIVIGTMQRHRQTADAILAAMGGPQVEIAQDAGLNEYDFQALFAVLGETGMPPGLSTELSAGLSSTRSKKDFYKGLKHVLQLWAEDRLPGRVLVVSSGGPISVIAQQVLQAPNASAIALNMQIRNSSVCQYVFNGDAMSLVSFNSVPHLERAERHEFVTYG
jgi:broad specificity phosphatase PhoE